VILAAPSHATRAVLERLRGAFEPEMIFVSATKGVEVETGMRMSEVVRDVLGGEAASRFVCLSGPSFAREAAAGQPTAVVAASKDEGLSRRAQSPLGPRNFRAHRHADVCGPELRRTSRSGRGLQ